MVSTEKFKFLKDSYDIQDIAIEGINPTGFRKILMNKD
jgi:hypothetical protein